MTAGGAFLRFGQTGLRLLQFCCSAIILGIFSYFLAVLSKDHAKIPTWERAVEGMSGAAALYTVFGVILTIFLGGKAFFGYLAVILDICFFGCFCAIANYTSSGRHCSAGGILDTPLGRGPSNADAPGAGHYSYVCHLTAACFAVSIINIILFLVTAVGNILLVRHHKKEHVYGEEPEYGRSRLAFWKRKRSPYVKNNNNNMAMA